MYEVKLNDGYFYYPNDKKYIIYNPILNLQLNDAGYFECDIPQENPRYSDIVIRQSIIAVYKDGEMVFRGEVRESEIGLLGQKHIYAIGELAFLNDSIQPQARYQTTPALMFASIIAEHNSQVEAAKQFTVGMVTVTDPNDYVYRYSNYEPTLTVLLNDLCDTLGGYLRIRYNAGVRYLDLVELPDYADVSEQVIRLGSNILDYISVSDGAKIATAVVPLGARLDNPVIEGLDAYLTIENSTATPTYCVHPAGENYLYKTDAISTFGYCKIVKKWPDVTDKDNLLAKADEWLNSAQYAEMTYTVDAIDLSNINSSIDDFRLGDRVRIVCTPYNIDTVVPIQSMTITLNDASKDKITLGNTFKQSLTSQMASRNYEIEEQIPSQSTILQQAKQNAINILEGTEGGYISYGFNSDGQMTEMRVMDSLLEESATKKWVWNLGGLGFLERDNITDPWTDLGVAMTMDGQITADFVTTGTMYADRISGGTLTLGGQDDVDGVISVRDANDTEVVKISNAGIMSTSGGYFINLSNGKINGGQNNTSYGSIRWDATLDQSPALRLDGTSAVYVMAPIFGIGDSPSSTTTWIGTSGSVQVLQDISFTTNQYGLASAEWSYYTFTFKHGLFNNA